MVNDLTKSPAKIGDAFDLILVGSGVACSLTLQSLLESLTATPAGKGAQPVRIAVIEREDEVWRGMPYGVRSSRNGLIITTLGEFVPDAEHDDFVAWIQSHRADWEARMRDANPAVTSFWLADNKAAIDAGDWDEVYVPRVLYGDYTEAKTEKAVATARAAERALVTTIKAEAAGLRAHPRGYEIALKTAAGPATCSARLVVLTIGSPPVRSILADGFAPQFHYVADAYGPSMPGNVEAVRETLQGVAAAEDRNLLIVGANATCLELSYLIARDPTLRDSLNRLVTLSLGGVFPRRMTRNRFRSESFPTLEALLRAPALAPDDIILAVEADLAALDRAGMADVGDTLNHLSGLLVKAMERLGPAQQKDFHHRHGMRFTRLIRRAGAEYRDAVQSLIDGGTLEVLKGRLIDIDNSEKPGFASLRYAEEAGVARTHPLAFASVINTGGFETVSGSSSNPVLADIVRSGLATVNETGRGFVLNEALEAAPGLYVNGPLAGGIFNATAQFWHVENVRRIHSLAQSLGPSLQRALTKPEFVAAI